MGIFGSQKQNKDTNDADRAQWEAYKLRKEREQQEQRIAEEQEAERQRQIDLQDPNSQASKNERKRQIAEREAEINAAYELQKQKETLKKSGLDLDSYSDEELQALLVKDIADINLGLMGTKLYQLGSILTVGNSDTGMIMAMLRAQIEQNWVVIRQNELIIRELKKLNEK